MGDASMACFGVLTGEGETGNFNGVGNSPSVWRVWDFRFLFVSYVYVLVPYQGFPRWRSVKNPPANAGDSRCRFYLWLGKSPWSRIWQPTVVFLPGESHGQRSLVGYSLGGCRVHRTEWLNMHTQACVRLNAAAVLITGLCRSYLFPSSITYMCI